MKEPRMGHTKMYFPFGALSLVPQIAAFHKKLSVGVFAIGNILYCKTLIDDGVATIGEIA